MTNHVMTVLGPVSANKLGIVLPHEHLLVDIFWLTRISDHLLKDVELVIEEVKYFRNAGGSTVVELSNLGLGRDPIGLQRIANETGLHIIMGCGWYREPFYDVNFRRWTTKSIADTIIKDINEGVDDTGIRPGIIGEIGSDLDYVSPAEERSFRAAARAHLSTGLTITTHADYSPLGLDQLDILEEEAVDLRRVIIGHADSYPDPAYHEAIVSRGSFVQFDNLRGLNQWETQLRLGWLKLLIDKGYLKQILISQDICYRHHLHAYGGNGYDYILTGLVPLLLESGFSKEQIQIIIEENPRAALTGERL
jgi:phosphotriesterase-related protein